MKARRRAHPRTRDPEDVVQSVEWLMRFVEDQVLPPLDDQWRRQLEPAIADLSQLTRITRTQIAEILERHKVPSWAEKTLLFIVARRKWDQVRPQLDRTLALAR